MAVIRNYNLVEETSVSTGTSDYVMEGALPGRRTFDDVVSPSARVPYGAVDDATGDFEFGIGQWDPGSMSLQRLVILNTSNLGAPTAKLSWPAGTRRVYVASSADTLGMSSQRHMVGSFSEPNPSNDETQGYDVGSMWTGTAGVFMCFDASTGNADWRRLATGDALVNDNGTVLAEEAFIEQRAFDGVAEYDKTPARGIAFDSGNPDAPMFVSSLGERTFDDTPFPLADANGAPIDLSTTFGSGMVFAFEAMVVATDGTDRKAWKVTVGGFMASGAITLGTPVISELYESAGASAWDVTMASSGAELRVMAKGHASNITQWNAIYTLVGRVDPAGG